MSGASTPNALKILLQDCWVQILDELSPSDATPPPLKRVLTLFRVMHERLDLAEQIHRVSTITSKLVYPAADREDEWESP
ncbi:hypothetical protein N7530_004939 [Penicillium desertorum]|uniref:Uncharacterized protein n=1 Tax=Penicillium desertorum TaxID=1303715 RepID=A0A9W9WZ71_9EURO|nr:hypothetical protein N7530_004939 [Penicillium desertorum]